VEFYYDVILVGQLTVDSAFSWPETESTNHSPVRDSYTAANNQQYFFEQNSQYSTNANTNINHW